MLLLAFLQHVKASFSFFFQQDNAPSQRVKDTVALLDQGTPDFVQPVLWPPNSLDLMLVDYTMSSVLQQRVYRTKTSDIDELKQCIISEWATLSHKVIECDVGEWCQRLSACVCAGGGHFEHMLYQSM